MNEPGSTALLTVAAGILMGASVLFSRASGRFGIPLTLAFLVVGMLAGSEGLGGIAYEDYAFSFRMGTVALVCILFDGGLNTPVASLKLALRPAVVLATAGVAGTAAVVAIGARLFGLPWVEAALLGAVVSSTDAAAVFSVLRGSGLHLKKRVGTTLELESGLNDPMAVLLTIGLTEALAGGEVPGWGLALEVVVQLAVGAGLGLALGFAARWLLGVARLSVAGLYPVLTLSVALLAFGVPTLLYGSGFLAVYVAGMVLGNAAFPYRTGVLRVLDAVAWFSQIAMFLLLGLLVFPSRLVPVATIGLGLAAILAFVARPLVVTLCLLPFRYPPKELAYVGWVGLRGAVPIILASFPVLAQAPGADRIFNLVFFVVVANALVPGMTVGWLTRRLRLESTEPPPPPAVLEITSTRDLQGDVLSFFIDGATPVCGARVSEIPFPKGSALMLLVRGSELLAAKGDTVLAAGDHAWVFCQPGDRAFLQLMFGRAQVE